MAADAGADAVGFVYHRDSPRHLEAEQIAGLAALVPAFVSAIGLFSNAAVSEVASVVERVHLDCLQFHGSETVAFCRGFGIPYIKAVRLGEGADDSLAEVEAHAPHARGLLFDCYAASSAGGTGKRFDPALLPSIEGLQVIIAGGLTPENVGSVILSLKPWAVDVSSGVERQPGVKGAQLVRDFIASSRVADNSAIDREGTSGYQCS